MTDVAETYINGRWRLLLPKHRADRREWPWWEATRLAAMADCILPGDVVWDVGAEEGDFPALWASWGARVVMAEPNPKVWPNIKLVWEANDLRAPLLCYVGFLGAEHVDVTPDQAQRGLGPQTSWPLAASGEVIGDHGFCQLGERPDLPTTTIDALVAWGVPAPTVITLDIEGSEHLALSGAIETLREHKPHVFVSIHPEFARHHYGLDDSVEWHRGFFATLGYEETFLAIDHEHHWWFSPRTVGW
jgi:FkbM family methyltransferase